MSISKESFFIAIVIFFAVSGLVVRNFPFNQGNIDKDMPPIITSFDLFAGTSYAKYIYDSEDARYNPPYRVMGVEKSLTIQPVFYFLLIASFTKLTSIPVYQTTPFITHFISVLLVMSVFVIVRRLFNLKLALVSSAIALFPESKWLFQLFIGFQYDQYSFLFVPLIFFLLINIFCKEFTTRQVIISSVMIGFFGISQWLSHFVELFLYLPFFALIIIYFAFRNKFSKEYFIVCFFALLVFLPFFLYFYPMTKEGHLSAGFSENIKELFHFGKPSPYPSYWPEPRFNSILNILSVLGIVYLAFKTAKSEWSIKQKLFLLLMIYIMMIGFSNYIGVDANRVSRQLFNGLSFLALLPAMGILLVYSVIFSNQKIKKFSSIFIILVLTVIFFYSAPKTYASLANIDINSFVDDAKWESIKWIRDNTAQNSTVFYLNGFFHEFSMFGERPFMEGIVLPTPESAQYNFQNLCSKKFSEKFAGHWGNGEFAGKRRYLKNRNGIFNFSYIYPFDYAEAKKSFDYNETMSLVPLRFFDYAVVQYKGSQFDNCIAFFLNESLNLGHVLVWNNQEMAIIKINKSSTGSKEGKQ